MAEAAGLVLGAIPLVVSALEHYVQGVDTIAKWWSYKRELTSLVRVLGAEHARFLGTCEKLLEGLVTPDELDSLVAHPGGPGWKDVELDRKLKSRLQRSYGVYLASIQEMKRAVKDLEDRLELNANGKPLWGDYHTFKHEYKRVKFSLSRRRYAEALAMIEKNNDLLASLTDQNTELEPVRKRRRRPIQHFRAIHEHARNLYKVIERSWTCDCGGLHNANLRLDARLSALDTPFIKAIPSQGESVLESVHFKVIFPVNRCEPLMNGPCLWRETEIRLLDRNISSSKTAKSVPSKLVEISSNQKKFFKVPSIFTSSAASSKKGHSSAIKSAAPAKPKKSVNFSGLAVEPVSGRDGICSSISQQHLSDLNQISNFCLIMQQCMDSTLYNQKCLGYLYLEGQQPLGVYLAQEPQLDHRQDQVASLAQIFASSSLAQQESTEPPMSLVLNRGDRLRLALTIASSVLQLYKTPWLREDWSKHDILINEVGRDAHYRRAYVSGMFVATATEKLAQQKEMHHLVRNESLFALAIVLIELCLGQTLESMRSPDDPLDATQNPNVLTDWCTVNRMLEAVYNEAGKRYGDAVRRCVHCEFDPRRTTLDDDEFSQAVYDGVIAPLEDVVKDFDGISSF